MAVRRFDSVPNLDAAKAVKLDNGMLRTPARIARVGVLTYQLGNGTVRRELRPAEEVFRADSLASFALVPVLNDHHPEIDAGEVNAKNARAVTVGAVGENIGRDGEFVTATLMIHDARAVSDVLAGKQQISCGYFCDHDPTPGVWNGQPYDVIQRNIRGNHVAIVSEGRAGPDVRVKLDSADGVMLGSEHSALGANSAELYSKAKDPEMVKINLDGVTYEVPETVSQAIAKVIKLQTDAADKASAGAKDLQIQLDKATARADVAEQGLKDRDAKIAALSDPAKLVEAVKARTALVGKVAKVLDVTKLDGLSDAEIRKAAVAKLVPSVKLDGKSAEAIDALFEYAIDQTATVNAATEAARAELAAKATGANPNLDAQTPEAREKNFADAVFTRWQKPGTASL